MSDIRSTLVLMANYYSLIIGGQGSEVGVICCLRQIRIVVESWLCTKSPIADIIIAAPIRIEIGAQIGGE